MAYERFWAKVNKTDDCWLWTGAQTRGYGQLCYEKVHGLAHRLSWQIHFGDIPDGLYVLHRCDVPLCVRPGHLFLGTPKDNVRDCIAKGRARRVAPKGEANGSSKVTEEQVRKIRTLKKEGMSIRQIADLMPVGKSAVAYIASGKNWRHVDGI